VCTTNPTLGRGLTLALTGAADLLHAIGQHGDDWTGQALVDRLVAGHIVPFYEDQAANDHARLMMLRHAVFGAPPPPLSPGRISYAQLRAAASSDPVAFRAFWKINGVICLPENVYGDPCVVACTQQALGHHGGGTSMVQPPRELLLAALRDNRRDVPD
jgi:hypothetical protein